MFKIVILKNPITTVDLKRIASEGFGDIIKAVVDVEKEIMAIGGELHVDIEVVLMENHSSLHQNTWGINLYPNQTGDEFVEFDSMINLKPSIGNRTRNVEDLKIQKRIREIVKKFIL